MKNLFFSRELIIAIGLVLVSQTAARVTDGVGAGEIILALFIGVTFVQKIISRTRKSIPKHMKFIISMLVFTVIVIIPITLANLYFELQGSSFRDILAYLLSLLLIFAIVSARLDFSKIGILLAVFLLIICTLQYFFGGENTWYSIRFTGGAKNPNQLAIFIICTLVMLFTTRLRNRWKIPIALGLVFFGIMTISDTIVLTFITTMAAMVSMRTISKKYLPAFVVLVGLPIMIGVYIAIFETNILAFASDAWLAADEGDARTRLFINGIKAYTSSPSAWPFGFGAGAFSGIYAPFSGSEAHNTFIDFLTVGGAVGVYLLFTPIIRAIGAAYSQNKFALASLLVGLIVFSMFHYIVRHPVFWVAIAAVTHMLYLWRLEARQQQIKSFQVLSSNKLYRSF